MGALEGSPTSSRSTRWAWTRYASPTPNWCCGFVHVTHSSNHAAMLVHSFPPSLSTFSLSLHLLPVCQLPPQCRRLLAMECSSTQNCKPRTATGRETMGVLSSSWRVCKLFSHLQTDTDAHCVTCAVLLRALRVCDVHCVSCRSSRPRDSVSRDRHTTQRPPKGRDDTLPQERSERRWWMGAVSSTSCYTNTTLAFYTSTPNLTSTKRIYCSIPPTLQTHCWEVHCLWHRPQLCHDTSPWRGPRRQRRGTCSRLLAQDGRSNGDPLLGEILALCAECVRLEWSQFSPARAVVSLC